MLLNHFRPQEPLKEDEEKAITALRAMLDEIANVKENHNRQAIRPSWGTFPLPFYSEHDGPRIVTPIPCCSVNLLASAHPDTHRFTYAF